MRTLKDNLGSVRLVLISARTARSSGTETGGDSTVLAAVFHHWAVLCWECVGTEVTQDERGGPCSAEILRRDQTRVRCVRVGVSGHYAESR